MKLFRFSPPKQTNCSRTLPLLRSYIHFIKKLLKIISRLHLHGTHLLYRRLYVRHGLHDTRPCGKFLPWSLDVHSLLPSIVLPHFP